MRREGEVDKGSEREGKQRRKGRRVLPQWKRPKILQIKMISVPDFCWTVFVLVGLCGITTVMVCTWSGFKIYLWFWPKYLRFEVKNWDLDMRFSRWDWNLLSKTFIEIFAHGIWYYIGPSLIAQQMIILYSVHMWYYIYTAVCISLCTHTSVL